jgi:DNA primase
MLWESKEASGAREYLLGRGLDEQALRTFRVGYAPSAWDTVLMASRRAKFSNRELFDAGLAKRGKNDGQLFDMFRRRITFPLTDPRGRVIGFGARAMSDDQKPKYVNTPESELFQKRRQVYAADLARAAAAKAGSVLVVEGYTDVVMLHQAGIENAVAIMGTSLTDEQVLALKRLAPVAHLALDADNAGQEAMLRAAEIAEREKLEMRIVPLEAGMDPAEMVTARGPDEMRALVDRSLPFPNFRVRRAMSQADTSSAEGKDRLLEDLKPVFRLLPPSIQRSELVRLVADRVNIPDTQADELLRQPQRDPGRASAPPRRPQRPEPRELERRDDRPPVDESMYHDPGPERPPFSGASQRGPGSGGGGPDLATILARTEEVERRFLAFCLALPDIGGDALAKVDLDEHFTSGLAGRAAAHLRDHLTNPRDDLPDDDPELDALITELVVRAAREPASPATLDAQRLQLELRRLDRRLAAIAASGEGGATELATRRAAIKAEFDRAIEQAVQTR